ncbi:hypothetical protein IPF89_04135 [Candidatus Saccharibacteria bacterium]|nr:MAG: hypothetical protein IPF89_04135 [Candidatus Saccharibacteria bacterium]
MTATPLTNGLQKAIERIQRYDAVYARVLDTAPTEGGDTVYRITDRQLFESVIGTFVTALNQQLAEGDLMNIYDVALHIPTKALIIANKGATLFSLTSKEIPNITRHVGSCVYMPGVGMEYANAGIVGNVYDDQFVLRAESACTPSFLFGSQRCNCHHQWQNVRELAASFNTVTPPDTVAGDEFERWVQDQFVVRDGKHTCQQPGRVGFVMLHVDSQNGMGSGYTEGEFVIDLAERASMRHRGEYTSEQTYRTSMYGGFTTIGINGDPRGRKRWCRL